MNKVITALAVCFTLVLAWLPIESHAQATAGVTFDDAAIYKTNVYQTNSVLPVTVHYNAGIDTTVSAGEGGIKFFLREMNASWGVVKDTIVVDALAIGQTSGTSNVEIPLQGLTATANLPEGHFYFLFVKFIASDGTGHTVNVVNLNIEAGQVEPSVSIQNSVQINTNVYANSGALGVTINVEAGTGNIIDNSVGGLKVYLRELNSDWIPVNDTVVYDANIVGQQTSSSTIFIPLDGLTPTNQLPSGNFYYLFAEFGSSDGNIYDTGLANIDIDSDFDGDSIVDSIDTDDDNDGASDELDPAPMDPSVGAVTDTPFFQGAQTPVFAGMNWLKIDNMSDEFEGSNVNTDKWQVEPIGNGWLWNGRPPGLFTTDTVSINDDKLKITVEELEGGPQWLDTPYKDADGNFKQAYFKYKGAIVRSIFPTSAPTDGVSYYYEAKMKANQTEMSSTFWLMSKNSDCNTMFEIDIQETIGKVNEGLTAAWAMDWEHIYHSNMFHRQTICNEENRSQNSVMVPAGKKTTDRYYVYGAHWKSQNEIDFYLDGKLVYSLVHPVAFNQEMWIQMAIETYDWNPVPEDGGMVKAGTEEQRTTSYEYVRTFKLLCEGCVDEEPEPEPVAPSLSFDNDAKYRNVTHLTTQPMNVTLNVEAGTGNVVTDGVGGLKVFLRELTSAWGVVKDIVVFDDSMIGQQTAASNVSIPLEGITPTADLPEGNFYFLYAQFAASNGTTYDRAIARLNIDSDFDNDGEGDLTDTDDDNDGVEDTVDHFPNDAMYGVLGDFDGDHDVDRKDLSYFARAIRDPSKVRDDFDFNNDGSVNSRDISMLRSICTKTNCAE
ncbi:dockerin type I domain-containing protein [Paraglaciecola sp. L3A3]|uniref:dockerin type I domain-containing protein n=1 Tax=Paraglaciecola sp. L3A3 TaxID=2686358 RepID=UPI00131A80E8|nr:dockerin type I domain-containing protein [Paraglaciecola sp. L3A3]